nr:MAG TPA: hypothetical protein [Caudoviricetes sp.]
MGVRLRLSLRSSARAWSMCVVSKSMNQGGVFDGSSACRTTVGV